MSKYSERNLVNTTTEQSVVDKILRGVPFGFNDCLQWLKLLKAQNSEFYAKQSATVDLMMRYLEREPLSP